ncbi:MAG: hypothetical protein CL512_04880 [Actinobacteria bacterium]|nr:hypothetical protein [Actinomycetota bacterium]|tara:strand:+ start:373 stop:855 length:483 start_codon:yes stop_codon:yes gene_type:complete
MAISPNNFPEQSAMRFLEKQGHKILNSIQAVKKALQSEFGSEDLIFLDLHDGYLPDQEIEWVSDPLKKSVYVIPYVNEYTLDAWCESTGIESNLKDGEDLKLIIDEEETEVSISAMEMLSFGDRLLKSNFVSMAEHHLSLSGKKIFINALMDYAQSFRTS